MPGHESTVTPTPSKPNTAANSCGAEAIAATSASPVIEVSRGAVPTVYCNSGPHDCPGSGTGVQPDLGV
jgi:hypothetical protein